MVVEAGRRNETERFRRIERENNSQLQSRLAQARRDLAAERQVYTDADKELTNFEMEVRRRRTNQGISYHTKCCGGGNFPTSPSTRLTSPLVTANAPSALFSYGPLRTSII